LPEPVPPGLSEHQYHHLNNHHDHHLQHEPVHEDHVKNHLPGDHHGEDVAAGTKLDVETGAAEAGTETPTSATPKKRGKKLPLNPHEALAFAPRGVYVDHETNKLRCSCNHKPCDKWDAYGYSRHFSFKVHRKYEEERLDDAEITRLREAKANYLMMNPVIEEPSFRKKRKMMEGEKLLSVDELRVQERHWMAMWKDAKNELRTLRQDLRGEVDEEVRAELMADIEGLKKRKGDWARLLGLNEAHHNVTATL